MKAVSDVHAVSVVRGERADHSGGYARARCSCGWRGQERQRTSCIVASGQLRHTPDLAVAHQDGVAHQREARP